MVFEVVKMFVTLFIAIGGGYLGHFLSKRREKDNFYRAAFDELISKSIIDLLFYLNTETEFRKKDIEKTIDIDTTIKRLRNNLNYTNDEVWDSFFEYENFNYYTDNVGGRKEVIELKLLFYLTLYSYEVMKKLDNIKDKPQKEVFKAVKLYGIWYIASAYKISREKGDIYMTHSFVFEEKLESIKVEDIEKIILDDKFNNMKKFLSSLHQDGMSVFD